MYMVNWQQLGQGIYGEDSKYVSFNADGTILAIGSRMDDNNNVYDSGTVRVYQLQTTGTNSSWVQLGGDINGQSSNDQSGYSVSLNAAGTRVAIGAPFNGDNGTNSGHVRVYQIQTIDTTTSWVQLGGDIYGEADDDKSGWSVSLNADGTRVAIGAIEDHGTNSGSVRVYQLNTDNTIDFAGTNLPAPDSWDPLGEPINGYGVGDQFGYSVSLNAAGTIVAIGAKLNDGNGTNSGHVRVYQVQTIDTTTSWVQLGGDINGEAGFNQSGWSVSLNADGTRVAIGGPFNGGSQNTWRGHVRVYQTQTIDTTTSWVQLGGDIDGEVSYDRSGWSVSLNAAGTIVAIGSIFNYQNGTDSGHVRVHRLDASNNWVQLGGDINGEIDTKSGFSVSLNDSGTRVAIGTFLDASVNVYKLSYTKAELQETYTNTQLKEIFTVEELFDAGYNTADDFFDMENPEETMFFIKDLNRVFSVKQVHDAGYTLDSIFYEGNFTLSELIDVFSITQLKEYFTATDLKNAGVTIAELKLAGFSASQLKTEGFTALELSTVTILYHHRVVVGGGRLGTVALKNITTGNTIYTINFPQTNGWSIETKDLLGRFTYKGEVVNLNTAYAMLNFAILVKNGTRSYMFQNVGNAIVQTDYPDIVIMDQRLETFDFTISTDYYYTAAQLKAGGYSAADLKTAGYTASELTTYYSVSQLKTGGYTYSELTTAGYTPNEVIMANICFPGDTPICTDQGIIPIEKINPTINTIENKKIVAITKTISSSKYLVCFEKNALGNNIPSQKTIMTKNHHVFYKDEMLEAKEFIDKFENVKKVKYSGEILYNILMKTPDKVVINNLTCETLPPYCLMAKLYTQFNDIELKSFIKEWNKYVKTKHPELSKTITHLNK